MIVFGASSPSGCIRLAAAEEATLSRIFAGVHFRCDLTSGHRFGRDVAEFAMDRFLTRRHPQDDNGDAR